MRCSGICEQTSLVVKQANICEKQVLCKYTWQSHRHTQKHNLPFYAL